MTEREINLMGGNVNAEVVRIGNTVRRAMSSYSPTIHRFLEHLRKAGFDRCPKVLGVDDKGREILQFIEGDTELVDDIWHGSAPLVAAANLVRQYHDASALVSPLSALTQISRARVLWIHINHTVRDHL